MPGARRGPVSSPRTGPSTMASSASSGMPPGRNTEGGSTVRSTMVDSTPIVHGPPSRTRSTSSPRSARTCSAVVGLTWPKRLAEGAAMPPPNASSTASVNGWAGTRRAMVSRPPATVGSTSGRRCSTMVSGPGQHAAARASAAGGTAVAQRARAVPEATCTMRGWSSGPALHGVDPPDGVGVGGVGAEAVHGLGGHGHQPTVAEDPHRFGHTVIVAGVAGLAGGAGRVTPGRRPGTRAWRR